MLGLMVEFRGDLKLLICKNYINMCIDNYILLCRNKHRYEESISCCVDCNGSSNIQSLSHTEPQVLLTYGIITCRSTFYQLCLNIWQWSRNRALLAGEWGRAAHQILLVLSF